MLLPKFDFHEPETIEEACQIMAELGQEAKPLAGGTDLIVNMKKKILSPAHLVSLARIENLKQMDSTNGGMRIGASITVSELSESNEIEDRLKALSTGARGLGSPLIRNLATIGGNLCQDSRCWYSRYPRISRRTVVTKCSVPRVTSKSKYHTPGRGSRTSRAAVSSSSEGAIGT